MVCIENRSSNFYDDILLVIGPPWGVNAPPMSLGYLSRFLQSQGINSRIFDLNVTSYIAAPTHEKRLWDVEYDYVWRNTNPVELIGRIGNFWSSVNEIIKSKCNFVGFSLIDPNQFVSSEIIKRIKGARPNKTIIAGGPVCATLDERKWLKETTDDLIDFMVVGEGEEPLSRLLERLKSGSRDEEITIPGVVDCRHNQDMVPHSMDPPLNLQNILFPDYKGFPLERYNSDSAAVLWSRGCISNCTFCKEKSLWDRYRMRSPDDILKEIRFHMARGISEFVVYDSLVNGKPDRLEHLCDMILHAKLKIRWSALAIPNKSLRLGLLEKMKLAGCFVLIFGLESGSEKILRRMRKRFLLAEAIETLTRTKQSGIQTAINIIVGFPGETESDFERTCDFLRKYHPLIDRIDAVTPFQLVKGTYISNHHDKFNIQLPKERAYENWSTADGMNTYEIRLVRRERIVEICKHLGIPIGKKFVVHKSKKDNFPEKVPKAEKKKDIVFIDESIEGSLDYDTGSVIEFLERFQISVAYFALSGFMESHSALNDNYDGIFAIRASRKAPKTAVEMAKVIRERNNNAEIILWGPTFRLSPSEQALSERFVDGVIFQQYEEAFLRLIKGRGKRTVTGRTPGILASNLPFIPLSPVQNLDKYPLPSFKMMMQDKQDIHELPLRLSKGCPHRCHFCSVYQQEGPLRSRSAHLVYEAMQYHFEKNGICRFEFRDRTINGDSDSLKELCHLLTEKELPITWNAKYIPHKKDKNLPFEKMAAAGCKQLDFGFISGSGAVLRRMGKPFEVRDLKETLKVAKASGLTTHLKLMVGYIGEEERDFRETINFLIENRKFVDGLNVITLFYPQAGSRIQEYPEKYGVMLPKKESLQHWHDGLYNNLSYRQKKRKEMAIVSKALGLIEDLRPFVKEKDEMLNARDIIAKRYINIPEENTVECVAEKSTKDYVLKGIQNGFEVYGAPETLEIDLTNNCNLNCVGCWCHSPLLGKDKFQGEIKRQYLSAQKIFSVMGELDEIEGPVNIQLSGAGEPFLHPDIWEIIEAVKDSQKACQIVTNFSLLNKTGIKRLIDLEVDAITASIWAGDPDTYMQNHPGVPARLFEKIRENLFYLTHLRGSRRLPKLKIYHVVNRHNANKLHSMVDFALQVGADAVEFQMIDIIPGKTDSLQLDQNAREDLLTQFQSLRLRDDYMAEFMSTRHLRALDNPILRAELKEFGRLYPQLPKGFQYINRNAKVRCPKGFESTRRSFSYDDFSIIFSFDQTECRYCEHRRSCWKSEFDMGDLRVFPMNILGAGSFVRRLTHSRKATQEYEHQIIDQLPCTVGWTYSRIKVDGHLIPCCKASQFPMGNIHKESFANIWHSNAYTTFRRKAVTLAKSNPYFSKIDCYRSCDNIGMNLNAHLRMMDSMKECKTDKAK